MWKYNTHLYFQNESRSSSIGQPIDQLRKSCCTRLFIGGSERNKLVISRTPSTYYAKYQNFDGGLLAAGDHKVTGFCPCTSRTSGIARFLHWLHRELCDGMGSKGEGTADVLDAMAQVTGKAGRGAEISLQNEGRKVDYKAQGREQVDEVELKIKFPQSLLQKDDV